MTKMTYSGVVICVLYCIVFQRGGGLKTTLALLEWDGDFFEVVVGQKDFAFRDVYKG